MPPDDKLDAVRSRMNADAISIVKQAPPTTSSPAPSDPETDHLAFENELHRYVADWLDSHEETAPDAKPYAFVFSRSITADEAMLAKVSLVGKRYEAFRHQKGNEITGCLIFATMNFEQAVVVGVRSVVDAQSLLDAVSGCGCQDRVHGVMEPGQKNLIVRRPNGSTRSMLLKPSNQHSPWTLDRLEAELADFHASFTRTPSGVVMPWVNAKQGITVDRLEKRISKALAFVLDFNFARGSVLAEVETTSGRMDVFLTPSVLTTGSGVIEVKVLRSYRASKGKRIKVNSDFNDWWATKGVKQADIYRNDYAAGVAYLCCFDARDADADLPAVEKAAKSRNVRSKRYFMYRSGDDLQEAESA
jgi:hypothetical protein